MKASTQLFPILVQMGYTNRIGFKSWNMAFEAEIWINYIGFYFFSSLFLNHGFVKGYRILLFSLLISFCPCLVLLISVSLLRECWTMKGKTRIPIYYSSAKSSLTFWFVAEKGKVGRKWFKIFIFTSFPCFLSIFTATKVSFVPNFIRCPRGTPK